MKERKEHQWIFENSFIPPEGGACRCSMICMQDHSQEKDITVTCCLGNITVCRREVGQILCACDHAVVLCEI